MGKRPKKSGARSRGGARGGVVRPTAALRIVGGEFRGRHLHYSGDLRTRPMKDRLREAIFNLIGPDIRGKHAIDLFAGTGALALEAISRGAKCATLIEQHNPTAELIRKNIAELGLGQRAEVAVGNTFIWWKLRNKPQSAAATGFRLDHAPWAVFCSPPYDFYVERSEEMLDLLSGLIRAAPAESLFVVEADGRFDVGRLPDRQHWDVRSYPPAVVGIFRKRAGDFA
ncbi:MAG: RsmD family RNA methyltransferase [Thermoguttaceae bacterium]|jgi:16S rRNA (guanine966-N2)-methyltransferase